MLRNEYPQRSDKGKEAKGVALRYGGVEDLVEERSEEESRITHIEYDVSRVVFDNSLWYWWGQEGGSSEVRVIPTRQTSTRIGTYSTRTTK